MGKDFRFRYSVEYVTNRGGMTPAGWVTRNRVGDKRPAALLGTPTDAKLARYVVDLNESFAPGGVNDHLGPDFRVVSAQIIDHDNNKRIVATWEAE